MSAENRLGRLGRVALATVAIGLMSSEVTSGNQECQTETWQAHYGESLRNGDYLQVLNEKAQQRYEQGMELWEDFVDIDGNPEMQRLRQLTEILPTSYIETEDNFEFGDDCAIDGFSMFIYDNPDIFGKGNWTIMIQMQELESVSVGTIYIQLDKDLDLFDGDGNKLSPPAKHLPFDEYAKLAIQSNDLFNVPDELVDVEWIEQVIEDTPESIISTSTYMDRRFRSSGEDYFQAVLPGKILMFGSTIKPKPEQSVDNSRIIPNNDSLI